MAAFGAVVFTNLAASGSMGPSPSFMVLDMFFQPLRPTGSVVNFCAGDLGYSGDVGALSIGPVLFGASYLSFALEGCGRQFHGPPTVAFF